MLKTKKMLKIIQNVFNLHTTMNPIDIFFLFFSYPDYVSVAIVW